MKRRNGLSLRIGIDVGGTKIELIVLEDRGAEVIRRRIPTPSGNYEATVKAIVELVKSTRSALGLNAAEPSPSVGIGIPGALSTTTGLVKNANSTCLIGKPLDKDIQALLGQPVRLANDADCFTLSEATDGAAAGDNIVFGVILGTGVGGGLSINRHLIRGPNAITGEWGHNPMPWPDLALNETPGATCYCGRYGCIETFLSGPGLVQDATKADSDCTFKTAEEIVDAANLGDSAATSAIERYSLRLAKALASIMNVIDPNVIVLGGGLSNISSVYETVPALWRQFVFSDIIETHLRPPQHGDSSGVRGAAWLWPNSTGD